MCFLQTLGPEPLPLAMAFDLIAKSPNRIHFVHLLAKGKRKAEAAKAAAAKAAAAKADAAKADAAKAKRKQQKKQKR